MKQTYSRRAERWLPAHVEPLTVRLWLGSPVAWDSYDGITLEGALQCSVMMLETGLLADDAFAGYRGPMVEIAIPIADRVLGRSRIALSSWGHPAPIRAERARVRRRRLRGDQMGGTTPVRMNAGPFKTTQLPTPTMNTPYLDFYVDGDPDRLRVLLSDLGAIGRARGGGLGHVYAYELLPREGDALVRSGRLTRTVPAGSVEGVDPSSYAVREAMTRAPYWHRRSRQLCWVPVLEAA